VYVIPVIMVEFVTSLIVHKVMLIYSLHSLAMYIAIVGDNGYDTSFNLITIVYSNILM
jgi:hypothetical protein